MYQVWTKGDEYSGWQKKDCPDIAAALVEVLAAIKAGKEPLLTVEVKYEVGIKVKEGEQSEVKKSKAKPDKGPTGPGDSAIRPGDETVTP